MDDITHVAPTATVTVKVTRADTGEVEEFTVPADDVTVEVQED